MRRKVSFPGHCSLREPLELQTQHRCSLLKACGDTPIAWSCALFVLPIRRHPSAEQNVSICTVMTISESCGSTPMLDPYPMLIYSYCGVFACSEKAPSAVVPQDACRRISVYYCQCLCHVHCQLLRCDREAAEFDRFLLRRR